MLAITEADNNELKIELGINEIKFIEALNILPDLRVTLASDTHRHF